MDDESKVRVGVEKLAYADSWAAINSYLSRTGAWELCSSPVRGEESQWVSEGTEMRKKVEAGEEKEREAEAGDYVKETGHIGGWRDVWKEKWG